MRLIATIFVFFAFIVSAVADQSSLGSPTTGTVSGLQLTTNYNAAINALNTCNSGTTAPTNQVNPSAGTASAGNCWLNTNTAPATVEIYDGTQWVTRGYLDTVSHLWIPSVSSNVGTVASAATTNLCSNPVNTATAGDSILISGTTTITSFGTNCPLGSIETIEFLGALTLTNSTSLVLPTGANITTAAGDWATFIYTGGGIWANVSYQRANGAPLSSTGISIGASGLANGALSYEQNVNLALTASVASNNLTITMLTADTAATPSATDPVIINFRNTNNSFGTPIPVKYTASTTFTINASNTMGTTNNVPFRLWIVAAYNGGTPVIGAYLASTSTSCIKINEGILQTSGAGANGGNSAGVLQIPVSAATGLAVKILGYMEWASGLGTAGTWNATPTYIQLMGPGIKSPCDLVATYYATAAGAASQTINPTSAANMMLVQCHGDFTVGTNPVTIFAKNGATPLGNSGYGGGSVGSQTGAITPFVPNLPGTTASTTYSCGGSNASAIIVEEIVIEEIMGALEPANENEPLRMTG